MNGSFGTVYSPTSQKAAIFRAMEEMDLPDAEPCPERIPNAVYFMMHEEEFKGDDVCLPFLEHLARLVAKDVEATASEGKQRLLGLDIGANIGAMMPLVIECCGGNAKGASVPVHLIAFEPNPVNLPMLESEVHRLHRDSRLSVSVCATVASDSQCSLRFHVNRKRNFAGNQHGSVHHFDGEYTNEDRDIKGGDAAAYLQLEADTVDSLLWGGPSKRPGSTPGGRKTSGARDGEQSAQKVGLAVEAGFRLGAPVAFVKIDTEGHEWAVLQGMVQTLRHTRFIFFEVSHLLRRVGVSVHKLIDWLDDLGFDTYRVGKKTVLRISGCSFHPIYETRLYWSNCLAMRKDEALAEELLRPFAPGARVF